MTSKNPIFVKNLSKNFKVYKKKKHLLFDIITFGALKLHRDFWALKDVSFSVKKGEILGILGRNGSGKSTLLKILSGVYPPSEGEAVVNGTLGTILELTAGFNPEFSGRENVDFFLDLQEVSEKEKYIQDIIEFTELEDFIDRPVKNYSSGMKSKLAFAVNTVIRPEVLFLDEVLSVGDAIFKRKSFLRMENMIKSDCTVVFVSHDLKSVREICSRVIILDKGELIFDGEAGVGVNLYQHLVHSPTPEKYKDIREQIKHSFKEGDISSVYKKRNEVNLDYIQGFQSENAKLQKHMDVDIVSTDIYDEEDKKVNILSTGKRYFIRCKFSCNENFRGIFFRMNIKSSSNIPISSHHSSVDDMDFDQVLAGDTFEVEWNFKCSLLAGVYFGNVEAYTYLEDRKQTLVRLVDGISFKVREGEDYYGDIVSLEQRVEIVKTRRS